MKTQVILKSNLNHTQPCINGRIDLNPSYPEARCFQAELCGELVLLHNQCDYPKYQSFSAVLKVKTEVRKMNLWDKVPPIFERNIDKYHRIQDFLEVNSSSSILVLMSLWKDSQERLTMFQLSDEKNVLSQTVKADCGY